MQPLILIKNISTLDKGNILPRNQAIFYAFDGNLYLEEHIGNGALFAYDRSISANCGFNIKIVRLFIIANDFHNAQRMLKLALSRERLSKSGISKRRGNEYAENRND